MQLFAEVEAIVPFVASPESDRLEMPPLDLIPAHVAVLDSEGVIVAVNSAWKRFADANGYQGADYGIGTSYLEACGAEQPSPSRFARNAAELISDVLAARKNSGSFVYPCHAPHRKQWFRMFVTPLNIAGVRHAQVMHLDVTEELETQIATLRETRQLRRPASAEHRLAGICHDLKSPLNAINGMCDFMKHGLAGATTSKQQEYLAHMLTTCADMRAYIDELVLDMLDEQPNTVRAVDVAGLLAEVRQRHAAEAAEAGIVLRCQAPEDLPPLFVSKVAVRRMVGNLVTNALRYAGTGSTVVLSARAAAGRLDVEVADDGVGVDAADLSALTAARKRGSDASASGTGLGLSVVKTLAAQYGASLSLESGLGGGFRATLTFRF